MIRYRESLIGFIHYHYILLSIPCNKQALEAEDLRDRRMDEVLRTEERKRSYNSLNVNSAEPTEEEMEAYRMKRSHENDPMAQFMSKKKK